MGQILVVEDNAVNRLVIEGLLAQLGLQVHQAHDGQQALDLLQAGACTPDLVLMDLQMPVLDGYATTLAIRQWEPAQHGSRLPIIALTADAFEEDRQRCLAVGMDDFLTKPIALSALSDALHRWLPRTGTPCSPEPPPAPAGQVADWPRFQAQLETLLPLLALNKFDAIAAFDALQAMAAHSQLAPALSELAALVKSLRFQEAAIALQDLAAKHQPPGPG